MFTIAIVAICIIAVSLIVLMVFFRKKGDPEKVDKYVCKVCDEQDCICNPEDRQAP